MSRQATSRRRAQGEGEYVTNWSAVLAAGGLGLLLVAGLAGAMLFDAYQPPAHQAVAVASESITAEDSLEPSRLASKPPSFRRSPPYFSPPPAFDVAALTPRRPAAATAAQLASSWRETIGDVASLRAQCIQSLGGAIEHQLTTPVGEPRLATVYSRAAGQSSDPTKTDGQQRVPVNDPLLDYLVNDVRELKLDDEKNTSKALFESTKSTGNQGHEEHAVMLRRLAQQRTDLIGLPLLDGEHCIVDADTATKRSKLSTLLRRGFRIGSDSRELLLLRQSYLVDKLKDGESVRGKISDELRYGSPFMADAPEFDDFALWVGKKMNNGDQVWKDPQQVAILEQVLQCENPEYRRMLVIWLSQIEGDEASAALARRAVFDPDGTIRAKAADLLRDRDAQEFIGILQVGMNYPLPSVARNAQEALASVQSTESQIAATEKTEDAASAAAATSDRPQPPPNFQVKDEAAAWEMAALLASGTHVSTPYYKPGCTDGWVVDELVKVNHLLSCVMCHPGSHNTSDPLRGQIPTPGERLPQVYYGSNRGNFVRANVVFIRQDFSVMLPVKDAKPWPDTQRYDFFRVTRPVTSEELTSSQVQRMQAGVELRRKGFEMLHAAVAGIGELADRIMHME